MGPGPSCVPDGLRGPGKTTLGHLDPYFLTIMDGAKSMLQELLNTKEHASRFHVRSPAPPGWRACSSTWWKPWDPVLS
jgi:alanine-glyoxylate transaminase/serine-glyoxylate transaminase/serine-pyruvate transaminase